MPAVDVKPLMWLFLVATVCLDIVLVKRGIDPQSQSQAEISSGFLIGQMLVTGSWLVVGHMHRLARAGVFVASMLSLTTLIVLAVDRPAGEFEREWGRILAVATLFSGICAAAAALVRLLAWWAIRRRGENEAMRFRLDEILGWMIIVAVASAALRWTDWRQFGGPQGELAVLIASSAIAGATSAFVQPALGRALLIRATLALGVVLVLLATMRGLNVQRSMAVSIDWAFVYLAAWLFVDWLGRHVAFRLRIVSPPETEGDAAEPASPFEQQVEDEIL
jgi:hypothetical protein